MRVAFKEWAVVVDALGRGDQILILRKGGIAEGRDGFTAEHGRFWLYPTAFHQQRESVIPGVRARYDEVVGPSMNPETVPVQFLVELEQVVEITTLETALALAGQHIWTDEIVRSRFEWGGHRRINVLLCHVFALPRPVMVPARPEYGGCRSWLELEDDPDERGIEPVMSRAAFESRCVMVELALAPAAVLK